MPTSFIPTLDALPQRKSPLMERFAALLEPKGPAQIEAMAKESQIITRRNFGKTMRLFAPLYVSNECVNNCSYCGFSRDNNAILRVTLTVDQVVAEAKHLVAQGFRNILLVAGPVLTVALITGLVIGIVQAATSINEQTLSFVPKLAISMLTMALASGFMLTVMTDYFAYVFETIRAIR